MAMALILIDTTLKCYDNKAKEQNDSEREKRKTTFLCKQTQLSPFYLGFQLLII